MYGSYVSKVKTTPFNLSHTNKFTTNMGRLVPILSEEVYPKEKFKGNIDIFARLQPLIAPAFQKIKCYTYGFFVPYRLIWDEWEDFITGGKDGNNNSVIPYKNIQNAVIEKSSLDDYLGLPVGNINDKKEFRVNTLFHRAYTLIYNEWFRDEDLVNEKPFITTSGLDETNYELYNIAWEKDYFTSARPELQKGEPVTISLADEPAPVSRTADEVFKVRVSGGLYNVETSEYEGLFAKNGPIDRLSYLPSGSTKLVADLSNASAITIDSLRTGFKLQYWKEKIMRCGNRYTELIASFFGAKARDSRLQRPELVFASSGDVVISEVLQTSSTDSTTPQGNMAGHGMAYSRTNNFNYTFDEHGIYMVLCAFKPESSYYQGVDRKFTHETRYDYLWPDFANLGEQAVLNKELFALKASSGDAFLDNYDINGIFGYQQRYQNFRYLKNSVHGDFADNLLFYHLARSFDGCPFLNRSFIDCVPSKRMFAVETQDEDSLLVQATFNMIGYRPLPKIAVPAHLN